MDCDEKQTIDPRIKFLEKLAETGNVSQSAREAGIARPTVYEHKHDDPDFAAAWEDALEEAADGLRKEARRRAVTGWLEPVFYQGEERGYITRYSDTLLCRLLAAHCPEHKDKGTATINIGGQDDKPLKMEQISIHVLSPEDRATFRELYQKALHAMTGSKNE